MRHVVLLVAIGCAAPRANAPLGEHAGVTPVTRAFVEDLVAGRRSWGDVVDPEAGVAFVQYTTSDSEPGVFTASSHLCGAAAARALDDRHARFAEAIAADEIFDCAGQTCRLGIAGEFASTTRLVFADGPGGLRLDAVLDVNSANAPDDEAPVLARLRAQQRGARCAR